MTRSPDHRGQDLLGRGLTGAAVGGVLGLLVGAFLGLQSSALSTSGVYAAALVIAVPLGAVVAALGAVVGLLSAWRARRRHRPRRTSDP